MAVVANMSSNLALAICLEDVSAATQLLECDQTNVTDVTADSTALALQQQMVELNITIAQTAASWPVRVNILCNGKPD
jgi:hypothetical protein